MKHRNLSAFIASALAVSSLPAFAITIKGKLPSGVDSVSALAVVGTGETADETLDRSSESNFELTVDGTDSRLYLIKDNDALPVLVAIKVGNQVYSVATAKSTEKCAEEGAVGLAVIKKNVTGSKGLKFKTVQISGNDAYAMVSGIKGLTKAEFKQKIKKYADKTVEVAINTDCSPVGNAATLGLSGVGGSTVNTLEEEAGDQDADGLVDELDVDDDGDEILDPYDSDTVPAANGFRVFTNLKVGIESTINKNAIPSLTDDQIDTVISGTQSMAIEVKTENSSGKTSELDCGSLNYCSAGGTGMSQSLEFPEDLDDDSDGFGKMTKGGTGDFQLQTGATSSQIGSGDVLIQTITDDTSSVLEDTYISTLNFAFSGTPALTEVVANEGDSTEVTFTPSYPVSNSGPGTATNPYTVQPHSSTGDIVLKLTAYRPQRKGITGAGESELVDIGKSLIVIDIPNAPNGGGMGPGGCDPTNYSESDSDLSTAGDTLVDAQADYDSSTANDGDGNDTVTFSVNITDCLAEVAETLDSGEFLKIDLQFKNSTGDNAAQAFYIERP